MTLNLPTKATWVLSIAATALAVLNEASFQFGGTWSTGLLVALGVLSALGISRVTGEQFRSILDLTNAESSAIAAVLTVLTLIAKDDTSLSTSWHSIIAGVIVAAAGLGFGPDTLTAIRQQRQLNRRSR